MSTPVVDRTALAAVIDSLPADDLAGARREAAEKFLAAGFPTIGQEDWKYTNLADVAQLSVDWLAAAGAVDADADTDTVLVAGVDAYWIVVRDGVVQSEPAGIDGIEIGPISGDELRKLAADDAMSAFNAALLRAGIRIGVGKSVTPEKPIGILYVDSPSNAVAQTRIHVELAKLAGLQLIEVCASSGDGRQFTNSVVDVRLAEGARLDHVRLQVRSREHSGVSRLQARLAKDAAMRHNSFDFGGALSRNDVVAEIAGTGADVRLNGLYLSFGEQHIDNHTSIIHGVGPSGSHEEYRGILTGRSRCVFNGKVVVAEGADGTDSSQSNHNLLLSDRAEIDTKPELEIYADDVKCAHGATVGQLDKASLFYLRSRGLDEEQARQILTRAFAAGALSSLPIEACHDLVASKLDEKLAMLVGEDDD
jgi:Fe-S cluster assembly protein SufD